MDIKEIARYTLKHWGQAQSLRYAMLLEQCFREIASRARISRAPLSRYPSLRVTRCEQHFVFHLHRRNLPPRVIAVLHEKMDILDRLKHRFESP